MAVRKYEFSKEQTEQIIFRYLNGESKKRIGESLGVSKSVIARILLENNIQNTDHTHKYKADYRKFQKIDSPEKAYWLGFIAADGCNYQRETNATIVINIARKDREHLEKFKAFMNSNVNIVDFVQTAGFSNNSEMSKISFNSMLMSQDLIKVGVPPKKSLILKPPHIEEQFFLPYILGYFDGDGSIFEIQSTGLWGINIEGTQELLTWINGILNISAKLEKRKDDDKNNYYIRCGGIDKPYQILKLLYESSTIHLDRKYDKFKKLETVVLSRNTK